jgi:riboflavin kinase/FMN adenylyltransferase
MKIYHHIDDFEPLKNAVVTIGTFDGVHLGHQKIVTQLCNDAQHHQGESVILSFFPHPRMILHPEDQNLKLITTITEKAKLLEDLGNDHLIITPFTRDFSNLSAEEYIREILVRKIGIKKIIIGYDHRFGKDRKGGLKELQRFGPIYNFEVEEIPEQDVDHVAVSSTKIREALLKGDMETANSFLGYSFTLDGKVIRGDQIGRKLGYPTANLFIEENYKLIPCDGIYAVTVNISPKLNEVMLRSEKTYRGMAYIGHRPTINGMSKNIEVNIFDFDADIYNHELTMQFHHFIREDIKFSTLEALQEQLGKDKEAVLQTFNI